MSTADPLDAGQSELGDAGGAVREEWRAEEEEYARAAAAQWAHGRGLVDIARELMHRGDTVAVTTGAVTFTGVVAHVGLDVLRLATAAGSVDVRLAALTAGSGARRHTRLTAPVVLRITDRARAGGRRGGAGTETFRARLLEHEADAIEVRLGSLLLQEELRGVVTVGRDQLCVSDRDGRQTYVPLAWVSWVMPWRE